MCIHNVKPSIAFRQTCTCSSRCVRQLIDGLPHQALHAQHRHESVENTCALLIVKKRPDGQFKISGQLDLCIELAKSAIMDSHNKSFFTDDFADADQLTALTGGCISLDFMDLDESSCLSGLEDTSRGIFDLFGLDLELQDADICDEIAVTGDDQILPGETDTLSPLPDLSVVESWSNIKPLSSTDSIDSVLNGRGRLPRPARELLDKWLDINQAEPYLKPNDAEALAHLTELTTLQVKTYVANARARRLTAGETEHRKLAERNS